MKHLSRLNFRIGGLSSEERYEKKERYEKMDIASLDRLLISMQQKRGPRIKPRKRLKGELWFTSYALFLSFVKGYTWGMGQDMQATPWYLEEPNQTILFLLLTGIPYCIMWRLYWRD